MPFIGPWAPSNSPQGIMFRTFFCRGDVGIAPYAFLSPIVRKTR